MKSAGFQILDCRLLNLVCRSSIFKGVLFIESPFYSSSRSQLDINFSKVVCETNNQILNILSSVQASNLLSL